MIPGATMLMSASLSVLFSYGGWQLITYIAPSVRNPQRTLPLAILLGVGGVVVVYLATNAAYVRVLGMDGLAAEPNRGPAVQAPAVRSSSARTHGLEAHHLAGLLDGHSDV